MAKPQEIEEHEIGKLNHNTWYYIYIDQNQNITISSNAPTKSEADGNWYHNNKRCWMNPIYIPKPIEIHEFKDE